MYDMIWMIQDVSGLSLRAAALQADHDRGVMMADRVRVQLNAISPVTSPLSSPISLTREGDDDDHPHHEHDRARRPSKKKGVAADDLLDDLSIEVTDRYMARPPPYKPPVAAATTEVEVSPPSLISSHQSS
jgi:hypothetical protein